MNFTLKISSLVIEQLLWTKFPASREIGHFPRFSELKYQKVEEGSSWGEKNNILNEDSEGTILISCLLFTLDSE